MALITPGPMFADSPLEGSGFELSVPPNTPGVFAMPIHFLADYFSLREIEKG
jgi:hypothetical protein